MSLCFKTPLTPNYDHDIDDGLNFLTRNDNYLNWDQATLPFAAATRLKHTLVKHSFSNARPSIPCPTRFVHYAIQKIVWNWRSRLFGDLGVPNKTTLKFSRTLRDPCRAFKTHAQTLTRKPYTRNLTKRQPLKIRCVHIYIYIHMSIHA